MKNDERYRVEVYTMRHDGTREYCICDYGDEARTGKSPIVTDGHTCYQVWTDFDQALRAAADMNAAAPARPAANERTR